MAQEAQHRASGASCAVTAAYTVGIGGMRNCSKRMRYHTSVGFDIISEPFWSTFGAVAHTHTSRGFMGA